MRLLRGERLGYYLRWMIVAKLLRLVLWLVPENDERVRLARHIGQWVQEGRQR